MGALQGTAEGGAYVSLNILLWDIWKIMEVIAFLLYLPLGILASIITVLQILFLCITVVGIPVAIVLAKSLSTYFNPVGKICVNN